MQVACHLSVFCLWACATLGGGAASTAHFSPIFYHSPSPLLCPASWGESRKRGKITPASFMIKNTSFEASLEVAMVMDDPDHWGAGSHCAAVIEIQSWGQKGAERAPEGLLA